MKIAEHKYFLAFLIFLSMLSPSCSKTEHKAALPKSTLVNASFKRH